MLPTISGAILGGQQYYNCLILKKCTVEGSKVKKKKVNKEKAKII